MQGSAFEGNDLVDGHLAFDSWAASESTEGITNLIIIMNYYVYFVLQAHGLVLGRLRHCHWACLSYRNWLLVAADHPE